MPFKPLPKLTLYECIAQRPEASVPRKIIDLGGWDYSLRMKIAARKLFMQGNGYKKTAGVIGMSEATVRDWNREFKAGNFLRKV